MFMNDTTVKVAQLLKERDSRTLTPLKVVKIEFLEARPCYDSEWLVTTATGKQIKIVRYADDDKEKVESMVALVPFEEILAKAVKANVYYD